MKFPTMSRGIVVTGLVILFVLVVIVRGIWIYEGTITAKDEVIQIAEAQRVRAEDREKTQRELTEEIRQDSLRRDLLARESISSLRLEIGTIQASMRRLEQADMQLISTLQDQPEIVESASNDSLALSIPPKILEIYPQYSNASVNYFADLDLFEINRSAASAFLLSLNVIPTLHSRIGNLSGQIDLQRGEVTSLNSIIAQQDIRVDAWTVRAESAELLNERRLVVMDSLGIERDAWEDKSNAQGKQLFLYKWGTRIGLTAAIVVGVLVTK